MARKLPSLVALKGFEAAARHASFSKAAQELCVTQGAVSRQVQVLEQQLNTALFRRRGRSVELTEQGSALYEAARGALDELERIFLRIKGSSRRDILTVNSLPTFGIKWLFPRLIAFADKHPAIEVRMISSIQPVEFGLEDTDVAVRVGRFEQAVDDAAFKPRIDITMVRNSSGLRGMKLMGDSLVAVCSPDFSRRHGPFREPADLRDEFLIHMASRPNAWPDWFAAMGEGPRPAGATSHYGHFFLTIDAALQGMGIALVPTVLASGDLAAGRLAIALDRVVDSDGSYYLLCRESDWSAPKVVIFREWIRAEAAAWAEFSQKSRTLRPDYERGDHSLQRGDHA